MSKKIHLLRLAQDKLSLCDKEAKRQQQVSLCSGVEMMGDVSRQFNLADV